MGTLTWRIGVVRLANNRHVFVDQGLLVLDTCAGKYNAFFVKNLDKLLMVIGKTKPYDNIF